MSEAYRIDMLVSLEGYYITLPDLYSDINRAREEAQKEADSTSCPCRVRNIRTYKG